MRHRAAVTFGIPAALAVLALLSIWPWSSAWPSQRANNHIEIFFAGLTEFAVVMTAIILAVRLRRGRKITALEALATFYASAFVPGILILLIISLFLVPAIALISLVALVFALTGRHLIGRGRVVAGTGILLVPVLL